MAVKIFKPDAINREYLKHCLDKLRSGGNHPGILSIHDHDLDGDPAYSIMDLRLDYETETPEPRTLETICGQIPANKAWALIGQLAEAMAHIHGLGIVHCGLKTSNIFLIGGEDNLRLQVSDLGQGWLGGVGRLALNDHTFYASPEQLSHPEQLFEGNVQSWDVYAFGAVAYRLLTGYFPRFEDELEALREQIEQNPELPIVFDPAEYAADALKYPDILWPGPPADDTEAHRRTIIERCLSLAPEDRFSQMGEVNASLSALASTHIVAPAVAPPYAQSADSDLDADESAPGYAKMATPAAPSPTVHVAQDEPYGEQQGKSILRFLPWVLALILAGVAALLFKSYSDSKSELEAAEAKLALTQGTINEVSGELANKTDLEQKTAAIVAENNLELGNAQTEKVRAQRNLAKAQDAADFFFSEFIGSGSDFADTPERRIAFERAENFYQSVLNGAVDDPNLLDSRARATLNLALIQNGLGKTSEAETGYSAAIESISKLIEQDSTGPSADDHQLRLARARVSSAKLRMSRGDFEDSLSQLEQANEQYRPFAAKLADDPVLKHSVAEVYQLTGKVLRELARTEEAIAQLGRAIELLESAEENPNTAPKDASLLSKAYFERGRSRLTGSQLDDGAGDHVKAVDILLPLHALDSDSPSYRHQLGINYWALGEMLGESGLFNEAAQAHSKAVEYLKDLVEQFPNTPEYKMALARDYASVARLLRDQGSPEKALDYQRGAVIFIYEVVKKAGATDLNRHELALNRGFYAELLSAADQTGEAVTQVSDGVTMLEEIRIKQTADSFLRKKFQISLAQLYGTQGEVWEKKEESKEEAITSFKKAVETWQQLTTAGHQEEMIIKGLEWSIEKLSKLDPEAMKGSGEDAETSEGSESA
ncbi:MAG: tetratricopeptide (TPR) repeat protein [Verrucomicrobiales bacterium]